MRTEKNVDDWRWKAHSSYTTGKHCAVIAYPTDLSVWTMCSVSSDIREHFGSNKYPPKHWKRWRNLCENAADSPRATCQSHAFSVIRETQVHQEQLTLLSIYQQTQEC